MSIYNQIDAIDKEIAELTKRKKELIKLSEQKHEDPKIDEFLRTYSGKNLLTNHTLQEEGVWDVFGEDPNCDFGGSHHTPYLGTYEGKLENVLKVAVRLDRFWSWGGGGNIKKNEIPKIIKI